MKHSLYLLSEASLSAESLEILKLTDQIRQVQMIPSSASFRQRDGKAMYVSCPDRNNERYV